MNKNTEGKDMAESMHGFDFNMPLDTLNQMLIDECDIDWRTREYIVYRLRRTESELTRVRAEAKP